MADNVVDILVKTTDQASGTISSLVGNITGMAGQAASALMNMADGVAAPVAALAALGVAAFAVGDAFSQSYDQIRVGTGATGSDLEALKGNFKDVVSDVPADFGDASTAITQLRDQLDLSGPALTALSEQFLNLSRITKTDVNEDIKAGTEVFKNWNVAAQDQGPTLDMLFQASQATGVGFTTLASELSTNGVKLREMGLDVVGATGFLASLSKAGIDVSAVMPAMSKEFATAAKEGKNAGDVLAETFHRIQDAPNATAAAGVAVQVFGARAGPQLAEMIREGKVSLEAFTGQIRDFGSDTINQAAHDTEHLGEKLTELKNKFLVLAEPVSMAVFDGISHGVDVIVQKAGQLGTLLTPAFHTMVDAIATVAVPAWNTLQDAVGKVVGWLQDNVPTILDKVGGAFETLRGWLEPLISYVQSHQEVFERLGEALGIVAAIIGGVVLAAVAAVAAVFLVLAAAVMVVGVAIGALIAVLYQVGQVLWDVFQNVKDAVATAGGAIVSFFANIGQAILAGASAVANFFGNLGGWIATGASAVASGIGSIISFIGNLVSSIVSFVASLPGRIVAGLEALPGLLMTLISNAFNNITFAIGFAAGTIVRLVINLVTGIVSAVTALPGVLANIFTSAWNIATSIVSSLVSAVVSFFQQLPGRAMGVLSAIWGVITSVFDTAKNNAVSTVTDLVNSAVNFFQQLPGRAASVLSGLWSAISGAFVAAWNGTVDKCREIEDAVGQFIGQIPGRARDALSGFAGAVRDGLSSAVSAAASIGSDIVHGIANGISSGVGFVIDAAKQAAGNIISGFKSALGISSPSKVAADEVGAWLPPGISQGITSGLPQVQRTLSSALGALDFGGTVGNIGVGGRVGVTAATARTAAALAGGGGLQVNFSGNTDTAFARAFMNLVRSGQIQISASAVVG